MTPAQCRAARAMLNMTQPELAEASSLGLSSVVAFETSRRPVAEATEQAIAKAFEAAGVVFLAPGETTDGGAGVRLAKDGPKMLDVAVVDRDRPKPDMPKAE